ncbi:MAG TPA: T9SS type A sorting domain-containing protein [Bacteroidia bacterium]|nr:T9SS type A sorting domain-containing protein [Bacteroidia bacterium]
MKLFFTSLTFFLFFACGLHSQNYRMLNAGSEFFFNPLVSQWSNYDAHEIFGLKCDSTTGTVSDSIYFPYRTVKAVLPAGDTCSVDPDYPIWIGRRIVIDNNGRHFFETFSGDSLILNTQTNPGDTQQIYLYGNGNRIIAIHTSNTQMTFATITDSVKNYSLQILDPANTIVPGYWNGKTIIVSKNNGVVQLPGILNFPSDTVMFTRTFGKRLTYNDVFPWQPGDELHEYEYRWDQMTFYNSSWTYNKYILSRTMINPDSVDFRIKRVTHFVSNGPPLNTITTDTIMFSVGNLSSFIEPVMPQQSIDSTRWYQLYNYPSDCGKLKMIDHTTNAFYIDNQTNCVWENNFEPAFHDNIYIDGVAGYYFYDFPSAQNGVTTDDFHNVYYSIGSATCGMPLYIGIQEMTETEFHVSPNPTTDFLNFDFPGNYSGYTFGIFDLAGKQIQTVTLEKNMPVDVRNLAPGFYVGKIISADGNQQSIIRFVKN